MSFDITWTITAIIAVSSFLSPIFVVIINNKHHSAIRKLELEHDAQLRKMDLELQAATRQCDIYYADKKAAFSNFLEAAGRYPFETQTIEVYHNLLSSAGQALLFCESHTQEAINSFILYADDLFGGNFSTNIRLEYSSHLRNIAQILNDELETSKPIIQSE